MALGLCLCCFDWLWIPAIYAYGTIHSAVRHIRLTTSEAHCFFPNYIGEGFWVSVTSNGPHFVRNYPYPLLTCGQRHGQSPKTCILSNVGHNMAQAICHWSFATKAWVRSQASPCWVCDWQNGTEAIFSKCVCFSLVNIIPHMFHTHVSCIYQVDYVILANTVSWNKTLHFRMWYFKQTMDEVKIEYYSCSSGQ